MPSLKELRERSRVSKELQEQKVIRIKDAVTGVVNSSAFALTAANQLGTVKDGSLAQDSVDKFASDVATNIVQQIDNPVNSFMDACRARGMKPSKIRKAVEFMSETFGLEPNAEYDVKLEAVALYLQQNPKMFDDITMLR